jgi:hypothetical protein
VVKNKDEQKKSGTYWTYGSNEGRGCEKIHGWCPSKAPFNVSFWAAGQPKLPFEERCKAFKFGTGAITNYVFEDALCTATYPYICEVFKI